MQWLNKVVDEIVKRKPEGEIVVSSGVSPSGKYHLGTLREIVTADAVLQELKKRGRTSRHVHFVDNFDVFRKVPTGIPAEFDKYLGKPLSQVPAPDGSTQAYADYYLADLLKAAKELHLDMEIMRAYELYQEGFFVSAVEKALNNVPLIRKILADISGRKLDEKWSPIQVLEDNYLKNRSFVSLNITKKELTYIDKDNKPQITGYTKGEVKLNWRIDWPARWWLLDVTAEPFGRDHASKGGSFDTGVAIVKDVFGTQAPLPIPYHFINRTGDTKKMSKSAGDTIAVAELLKILPPEVVRYFILRFQPDKQLFFDSGPTLIRLVDEFSELLAKPDKSETEKQLLEHCNEGISTKTISSVPFSHLVASYQASLKDPAKTLDVIARTEHSHHVQSQSEIIVEELKFIDNWLDKWAPYDVKFELRLSLNPAELNETQKQFLNQLASVIENAPDDADGDWFHKEIYNFKDQLNLAPELLFKTLYLALIGKDSGPRAGWFLSILPRKWLIKRLRLEA